MNIESRRAKLAKILKFFEKEIDMSTYKDRLILQKLIYILKSKGVDFDYNFGWYLRGPYSSSLANDGYVLSEGPVLPEVEIPADEKGIIGKVKYGLGCDIKDEKRMEIIASLLFLKEEKDYLSWEEIVDELLGLKPWLETKEIKDAMDKINLNLT